MIRYNTVILSKSCQISYKIGIEDVYYIPANAYLNLMNEFNGKR